MKKGKVVQPLSWCQKLRLRLLERGTLEQSQS